jgi:hypothetical protein
VSKWMRKIGNERGEAENEPAELKRSTFVFGSSTFGQKQPASLIFFIKIYIFYIENYTHIIRHTEDLTRHTHCSSVGARETRGQHGWTWGRVGVEWLWGRVCAARGGCTSRRGLHR